LRDEKTTVIDFYGPIFDAYLRASIIVKASALIAVGFGAGLLVGWLFL
jgi:uncharacterized membrane protein YciS (DUF1049 family)